MNRKTITIEVEVRLSPKATARFDTIRKHVNSFLLSSFTKISLPSTLEGWEELPVLGSSVERIVACESPCPSDVLPIEEIALHIHVYQPSTNEAFEEFSNGSRAGDEEEVIAANIYELPNRSMEGLWDSLIYAENIKMKLLDYIYATLILSDANVDCAFLPPLLKYKTAPLIISQSILYLGIVLFCFTGLLEREKPPFAVRWHRNSPYVSQIGDVLSAYQDNWSQTSLIVRYAQTRLLEINSHSLFSRWFSESGKLVQRLFNSITELVDEEETFVVVLMGSCPAFTSLGCC